MSVPKYKKQYDEMVNNHQETFNLLKTQKPGSDEFRETQFKLLRIIRKNEDILCSKTENTKHSSFSTNLADKFMEEVRANYPEIDYAES